MRNVFKKIIFILIILGILGFQNAFAIKKPITHSISTKDIKNYNQYPPHVKALITESLKLTKMNLSYMYGSSNPKNGGMDCSGVIQYVLQKFMEDVPRQADELYKWAWTKGHFVAVTGSTLDSFEFSKLKPGDILFWSGTYKVDRKIPVTHVMIYLGKNKKNQPILFGSSDGRYNQSKRMYGVSVFDFKLPSSQSKSRFLGYSCIPNLTCLS